MNSAIAKLANKRANLEKRAAIFEQTRAFFRIHDFLEVETPIRVRAPAPELHIDCPPSRDMWLLASPELQMKQLLVAGYERIFQISKCFRENERGPWHLPEFSMLEWYRTGGDIDGLMKDCEDLIRRVCTHVSGSSALTAGPAKIPLPPKWQRISVADAFERFAGWRPGSDPDPNRFDTDLVNKVEPALKNLGPVFLHSYPASMASLARLDPKNPDVSLRFELYIGGLELANGFDELTDPVLQRSRFDLERQRRALMNKAIYPLDHRFLSALEDGMPPCAGIALGMDRLVMLLTGASSIDEVTAFPDETS